jgi:hypothetical protein
MKIENEWSDLGDNFDGCKIEISHEEFLVFNKVFTTAVTRGHLKKIGFTEEQIRIFNSFCNLY